MPSRQQIKQRIRSVKNTKQITRAMQMVAASKLRRAQDAAIAPREYARLAREVLTHLRRVAKQEGAKTNLFTERPVKQRLLVVIASNRGLAGAYNANVIKQMIKQMLADKNAGVKTLIVAIGRQAANAAARLSGVEVVGAYTDLPEHPTASDLRPILNTVTSLFESEKIDGVDVIYTKFVTTMRQDVEAVRLLPAGFEDEEVRSEISQATIEPSVEEVLAAATVRLLEAQLYQSLLEAAASEQSMRMVAMKNASDNAGDIIDDLTLAYNTARQGAITQELAEISAGVEAMK